MKFKNRHAENAQMVENVCLILSLGAIFTQIWVLVSAMESYLEGKTSHLLGALALSGIALLCCALTAATTTLTVTSTEKDSG